MLHFTASAVLFLTAAIAGAADWPATMPAGVPKDAVAVSEGLYRSVDKNGKAWLHKKTPFGYMKSAEEAPAAEGKSGTVASPFGAVKVTEEAAKSSAESPLGKIGTSSGAPEGVKVQDKGDEVQFERRTPFGTSKWTKKKQDLSAEERGWMANPSPSAQPAAPVQ